MGVYVGKSGTKKQVSSIYIGKSGVKNVSKGYALNGSKVQQVYNKKGQQIFTSSGTFTVPGGVTSVDVFLVGGGGKGGGECYYKNGSTLFIHCGSGGGSGYTKTVKGVSVTPGIKYSILVGAGSSTNKYDNIYTGGSSSALGYSANGGENGIYVKELYSNNDKLGGKGGSGGGQGCIYSSVYRWAGNGGSDGNNGYYASNKEDTHTGVYNPEKFGGYGQATTTRAFGDSDGTLYAGGGGGSGYTSMSGTKATGGSGGGGNGYPSGSSGTNGTGSGGGGGCDNGTCNTYYSSMGDAYTDPCTFMYYENAGYNGGSGIVIIRWGY